jgi:trans-L-3-hydroxyproline dehydratase
MYGGFIVPSDGPGAHFGVLFFHNDGFSTACGHGTIALGYWAVRKGLVEKPQGDGVVDVVVDVPSGRVVVSVAVQQGKAVYADFINVLSYQLAKQLPIKIPSYDMTINVDVSFGGAVFASVDVSQMGLTIEPKEHRNLVKLAKEIKDSVGERGRHGTYSLFGVILYQDEDAISDGTADDVRQKNVNVFADGQIDRSPCGSGTCARLAVLHAEGRLGPGRGKLRHHSIIGTLFVAEIVSESESPVGDFPACIPKVRGGANLVGRMNFFIDPEDTLFPGFLLR